MDPTPPQIFSMAFSRFQRVPPLENAGIRHAVVGRVGQGGVFLVGRRLWSSRGAHDDAGFDRQLSCQPLNQCGGTIKRRENSFSTWMFPKIVVPPNHPRGFHQKPSKLFLFSPLPGEMIQFD